MLSVFSTPILYDVKRYADQKKGLHHCSAQLTLITSDHLELNRNHMNHVQHDSSRGPQPTYDWDYNVYTMVIKL